MQVQFRLLRLGHVRVASYEAKHIASLNNWEKI